MYIADTFQTWADVDDVDLITAGRCFALIYLSFDYVFFCYTDVSYNG